MRLFLTNNFEPLNLAFLAFLVSSLLFDLAANFFVNTSRICVGLYLFFPLQLFLPLFENIWEVGNTYSWKTATCSC